MLLMSKANIKKILVVEYTFYCSDTSQQNIPHAVKRNLLKISRRSHPVLFLLLHAVFVWFFILQLKFFSNLNKLCNAWTRSS